MTKWLLQTVAIGLLFGALGTLLGMQAVHAQTKTYSGPRIVWMGQQDMDHNVRFKFFHDQETGQEIVCTDTVDADACYLTGRKW
jgi:hypothetical protein